MLAYRHYWHMFQSHAGSIEAVEIRGLALCRDCGFNPTLVRLRPSAAPPVARDLDRFQSHAGSIEAPPGRQGPRLPMPFQSHAGSIEASLAIVS